MEHIYKMLGESFAISEEYANSMKPMLVNFLKGGYNSYSENKAIRQDLHNRTSPLFGFVANGDNVISFRNSIEMSEAPAGSIALIRVNGFISQEGNWCMKGLDDYQKELTAAGMNKNIKGVILQVNSGGGSVNGVSNFSDFVGKFESKFMKPIAAFVDNMAASAAYWIISQAPRIFANGESTGVGSIGTLVEITDWQQYMENEGIKEIAIFATKSVNKQKEYRDVLKGDNAAMVKMLNKYNEIFLRNVERGRAGKLNTTATATATDLDGNTITFPEVLSGAVYVGNEIVSVGLVDEIADLDSVVKYIEQRANQMGIGTTSTTIVETASNDSEHSDYESVSYNQFLINTTMFTQLSNDVLQAQFKVAQSDLNAIATEKGVSSSEYKAKANEVAAIEREVEFRQLKASEFELAQSLETTSNELKASASEVENLKAQLAQLQASNVETLTAEIEALKTEKEALTASNAEIEAAKAELSAQLQASETLSSELKAKVESYEGFIQSEVGELPAVVAVSSQTTSTQPEAYEPPKGELSAAEQVLKANRDFAMRKQSKAK